MPANRRAPARLPTPPRQRAAAVAATAAALLLAHAHAARAQEAPGDADAPGAPLWELGLGVGALSLPHYRGSDQARIWWLPVPYVVYRGDWLKADREGARAQLLATERHELSVSLNGGPPTGSEDNRARAGMPDLPPTVELGPVLRSRLWAAERARLELRLPLRAVFGLDDGLRHLGWSSTPVVAYGQAVGDWRLGAQSGPVFGDARLHAHYHGVSAAQATATRPAYAARAGYGGWQSTLTASRAWGDFWIGLFARHDTLSGAVFDDSPLVRERSQWSGGLAVSWVFARSARTVAER